jgi:predicted lipoprotein with Yx(FWY)xxD motif
MKLSRIGSRLAAGIAVLVIAPLAFVACGSDDDDPEPTAPAATAAATSPAEPEASPAAEESPAETPAADETPASAGATVAAGPSGLVDGRGFSLYFFANDVADSGSSACGSGCIAAWPPLLVDGEPSADAGVTGELGSITRDDGSTHVTYNGLPLYFFVNDAAAGDTNGAEVPNWSLAQP